MSHPTLRRRAAVAIASVALVTTALLGGALNGAASAAPAAEPPSTPAPISTPDGLLMSYIINAKHANHGQVMLAERAVTQAGGVVVQSWPEIGVIVAHADKAAFRTDVVRFGNNAVESVGATRSVAVSEGTPSAVPTPWAATAKPSLTASTASTARSAALTKTDATEATQAVVADPREVDQWDMRMIKADQAHAVTDGSRNVVVGVLDSGIDPDHPDLVANIDVKDSVNCTDAGRPDLSATGWNPTTSDHGTHVSGTIAAARNGVGIVGVAPNVRLASVKVVNDAGFIYPEYAVCGFVWAGLKHMDVTNNSYYIDPFEFYCSDQPDQFAAKEAVRRAVEWSTQQGVVHAAAAGNSAVDLANKTTDKGSPDDGDPIVRTLNSGCEDIPTELGGVVTVSSMARVGTTTNSILSSFSNRGLGKIDVAAPGSSILSTIVAGNGYGLKSGTSMASPHVAGVLALMKSAHPSWTPAQLIAHLRSEADDKACTAPSGAIACVGPVTDNSYFGEGVLDALDAVQ